MPTRTTTTKTTAKKTPTTETVSPKMLELRTTWTHLYRNRLPQLAAARKSANTLPRWPVSLDHCFARIILDNAVGIDRPWDKRISAPATSSMSEAQLKAAIALGEEVYAETADLDGLNDKSLRMRGKRGAEAQAEQPQAKKSRKNEAADNWEGYTGAKETEGAKVPIDDDLPAIRARIAGTPSLTPFRRQVLALLTQVPRGQFTTYKALADAVGRTKPELYASSAKGGGGGCARAVGSAMRTNPFAPQVPCHRVLAADGKIGGFAGDWGEEGRFVTEKRRLLREEGVKFDGKGKVVGSPFVAFV